MHTFESFLREKLNEGFSSYNIDELVKLYEYLSSQDGKKIVFFTTSNRWEGEKELPKSSILAEELNNRLDNCDIINVSKLKIFPCEGNVSTHKGNNCGVKEALLKGKNDPNEFIRCWASINNKTDEIHKVANAIYDADIIIFFGSIRWGKMNAVYTQLIERLTWLENRHTTLGEDNLLKDKEAGVVAIGHNWNGKEAVELEKEVLKFFGFKTPKQLTFNWQYLKDSNDETQKGYKNEYPDFVKAYKDQL
jgi:multimeric flavodoxin WrbA